MQKFDEYDTFILKVDLPEHGLQKGRRGVVLLVLKDHDSIGYAVEFVSSNGETIGPFVIDDSVMQSDNGD
ncbi:DUF4926 domain-containing protein [Oligoflexus tunisiensis]|uniref:DUF4926 domain-containing protein n=1 Tax=Oligoflexus tunisiensis TaxID=708132 RepID=UPI00114C9A21|nr:DUF4926 domain-containing protein [Oligoflexus tunisiensis]